LVALALPDQEAEALTPGSGSYQPTVNCNANLGIACVCASVTILAIPLDP
jgi:hypothetical protein